MRYSCSHCEFVAIRADNLKIHVEKKHKEVRYPCSECKSFATKASTLRRHVVITHEGVKYPCSDCEYIATQSSHVRFMLKGNIQEWDILVLNVSMLLQTQET